MNKFPTENIDKVEDAEVVDVADKAISFKDIKNIKLTGDVTGTATFDGTQDASISATIKDNSHNHVIANVDNLQSTLDAKGIKLSVNGKTVSLLDSNDNVLSSIDTQDTNTTYIAATAAPKAPGTAAVGTSTAYAREDHVHPTQTNINGNVSSATKAIQDESGNNIKDTYVSSMSVSNGILTYKNKNNIALGTVNVKLSVTSAAKLTTARTFTIPSSVLRNNNSNATCSFDGTKNVSFKCSGCSSCSGTCTGSCTGCKGTCTGCTGSCSSSCSDHTGS